MLDKAELAQRIKAAIAASPRSQADIAAEFDVTEQAVSGWARTGKVDKRKLPRLAALTGVPLSHFLPDEAPQAQPLRLFVPSGTEAMARIAVLERAVDDLVQVIVMGLTRFSATTPAAGQAVAADLRAYLAQPGTPSEVLPEVMRRLEEAQRQHAPSARRTKPSRQK